MSPSVFKITLSMQLAIVCIICMTSSNAFISCHSSTVHREGSLESVSSTLYASTSEESIVERCYGAWNRRTMSDISACFADEFEYDDGQYLGSINKKSDLERLFQRGANALPPKARIVVDHIAKCGTSGNIGAQWHVEREDGTVVPFTRGCSFYTIDKRSGLIKTGFKVSEMIIKPSKQFSDGLVSSASKMMQATNVLGSLASTTETKDEPKIDSESIIETYFRAWNKRDMEAALDCFIDDCIYETEDPVFVDAFQGKEALREHLLRNVEVLPSACKIILDDLAVDSDAGKIGVKWHLEANGVPIPNLRGCSMYTTDDSGLLRTGFDVTEAPVKLPGVAQDLLALPFGKLMF